MTVNVLLFTDCASKAFARSGGAYRIASELRTHGYTVQVVDHFLLAGLNKTLAVIDKFVGPNTLFVGFSTTFMNVSWVHLRESFDTESAERFTISGFHKINSASGGPQGLVYGVPIPDDDLQAITDRVKSLSPKAKMVIGGTKADFQRQMQIDAFILGYADTAVLEYVRYLEGKNPFFQFTPLGDGRMAVDRDLDATSFDFQNSRINYHESDVIRPGEVLPIEVARGCIFKCKFCAFRLTGKKKMDHIKDAQVLYDEMMHNYEKFGTTKYIFSDDTYNDSVPKLEAITEMSKRLPFKLEFAAYLRHDLIWRYPEMADLLRESGLKTAIFGIETLNHQAGKLIGKGLDPKLTRELLQWLRDEKGWKNNVMMGSGFISGLPTENASTVTAWAEELLDYSYPLDSFVMTSLSINPSAVRIGKSEFELNYEKYGYYFDPARSESWSNEHWTYEEARDLANDIMSYAYESGRIKSYGFFAMMMHNYGFTWEQLHSQPAVQAESKVFDRTVKMVDDYYKQLLAL